MSASSIPTVNPRWARTVVVGIDFDSTGELALNEAFRLAAADPGVAVHVVHACAGSRPRVRLQLPDSTESVTVDEAANHLTGYVTARLDERTRGPDGKQVTTHLRVGAAADQIVTVAAEVDADVIFVGTAGRKGIGRWLLGSVAEEVVGRAGCPVLIVKPDAARAEAGEDS